MLQFHEFFTDKKNVGKIINYNCLETSIWFPTNPILDRWCQRPLSARMAASSNTGFPVNLDKVPNSMMVVPTPAVHVTVVSPLGTPYLKNSKIITYYDLQYFLQAQQNNFLWQRFRISQWNKKSRIRHHKAKLHTAC